MNMDTLGDMVNRVVRRSTAGDTPEIRDLIVDSINEHYVSLAEARRWTRYLQRTITDDLATVAGQSYLSFPEDCAVPLSVTDRSNDWVLVERDNEQLQKDFVSTIDGAGQPVLYYAPLGHMPTKAPLSAADELSIIAENANDKSVDVSIVGRREDPRVRDREVLTTDSSTPQSTTVSGSVIWDVGWSIMSISTDAELNGYITIHEQATSGNVLAVLTEHQPKTSYFVIQLDNDPNSANNLTLVYKARVLKLQDEADVPMIPVSSALVEFATAAVARYSEEYQKALAHESKANDYVGSALAEHDGQHRTSQRSRPAAARRRYRKRR